MHDKIKKLTIEYGGQWGFDHVQRLLNLIKIIGEGIDYDEEVIYYATYLHDWGAFPKFNPEGIEREHEVRSQKAAEKILADSELNFSTKSIIFDAIINHDYRTGSKTEHIETTLLREADFLDFLGIIGIAREFARGPRDIKECWNQVLLRRDGVIDKFTLPKSKEIAKIRCDEMDEFINKLKQESFGNF